MLHAFLLCLYVPVLEIECKHTEITVNDGKINRTLYCFLCGGVGIKWMDTKQGVGRSTPPERVDFPRYSSSLRPNGVGIKAQTN